MNTVTIVAAVLWLGVTAYAVLGGADFGAGFWDLVAGGAARGRAPRDLIEHSLSPVWEANHTWLIFDLVILWTAFPVAFAAIMSTLFVPFSLAALGIVLRGAGFAFRKGVVQSSQRRLFGATFAAASVLTPFTLGAALGGIAAGRVTVGGSADIWGSWLGPTSILTGCLAVAAGAYLAAVFLVADAARRGRPVLVAYFRRRAVAAGVVAGGLALAGFPILRADAAGLYDGLVGRGLPLVIVSVGCGLATLAQLTRGRTAGTRPLAVTAVAAVVVGWGVAQYPALLPGALTVGDAAAPPGTLGAVAVIAVVAALVIGPSLGLLLLLDQRGRLAPDPDR